MFPVIRTLFNLLLASRTNTPGHFIVVRQWASKRKPLNPFAERSEKPEAPTMITLIQAAHAASLSASCKSAGSF